MKKLIFGILRLALLFGGAIIFVIYALPLFGAIINIGNVFGMMLGVCICALGLFFKSILSFVKIMSRIKIFKVVFSVFCAFVIAFFVLFCATYHSIVDYAKYTANDEATVIVLGCRVDGDRPSLMLKWRCDVAAKYLLEHPDAVAILSGGQGSDENISEAECMFDLITQKGIDANRLYLEDTSTSTDENFANSKRIIDDNNLSTNVAVATSDYHEKRASIIAKKNGLSSSSIPAYGDKYSRATFFTREVFGIWVQYLKG